VNLTAEIDSASQPYELQPFVDNFNEQFSTMLAHSEMINFHPLDELAHNEVYQSIAFPLPSNLVSIQGVGDLSNSGNDEIIALRNSLDTDALLFVSVKYSLVELYWFSQLYKLRITTYAKLISTDIAEPIWETEFDKDFDVRLDVLTLLGLQFSFPFSPPLVPTEKQWESIMANESPNVEEQASEIAQALFEEILHGYAESKGLERPKAWELAKSSKWGKFGELPQAWISLQLLFICIIIGGILGSIELDAGGEQSCIGQILKLPIVAIIYFQILAIYYLLKALF
jgi:hypothetical protein